jgi:CelD/BcsL family acetyltransferase involved in cellulose biosynthesis
VSSYLVDPIADPRWGQLVEHDSRASLFHSPGWLLALRQTHGYELLAVTSSPPSQPLLNGVVFCRIRSWLTGTRLVSLPFSDHCEPLVGVGEELDQYANSAGAYHCRYVELRPIDGAPSVNVVQRIFHEAEKFWLHRLDLSPPTSEIFERFHADCVRRKIRKAEREHVVYEEGSNSALLESFYYLLLRTRRRHRLPPQPKLWFRNLARLLGDSFKIRLASKDGRPIASIVTFSYKNKLMYKYGCSDERYYRFGGVQLLLWRAIQEAKEKQYSEFDLGRCEWENSGLRIFKDRWGANRSTLTYWRYHPSGFSADNERPFARKLFRLCPPGLLETVGRSLYRHIG